MPPSEMLGALPFLGSIWDYGFLQALVKAIIASWGLMNLFALVLEWRILYPSQQYASFYRGDLVGLPIMIGAGAIMAPGLPTGEFWYQSAWWHIGCLVLGLLIGVGLAASEYLSGAYSLAQILSPTKIFHNGFVFPMFVYWMLGNMTIILWQSKWGLRGLLAGDSRSIITFAVFGVATVYYVRLLWKDIKADHSNEVKRKHAHAPLAGKDFAMVMSILALSLLVRFILDLSATSAITFLGMALFLYAAAVYGTTYGFDATQAPDKPWAHIPFHPRYLLFWRRSSRPPWSYDTRGITPPSRQAVPA